MRFGVLILLAGLSLGVSAQQPGGVADTYLAQNQPRKQMADIPDSARTDEKGLQSLRPYVIQLESMMKWESNTPEWKGRRDAWAQEVLSSYYVPQVAKLLLELEAATDWKAVDVNWGKARAGWITKVKAVRSRKALGEQMQAFEAALKWEFMQEDWKTARDGWVENVVNACNQ
ncbi:hypothetical protein JST97_30380 [bacterium]|nr:hypothetical protein [bacterium]